MKKILATVLIAASITACQKNVDWVETSLDGTDSTGTGGTGGGSTTGSLLVKTVTNSTLDSIVAIFSYDAGKKLIGVFETTRDKVLGATTEVKRHFIRDATGRIAIIKDSASDGTGGWDTLRCDIFYNGSGTQAVYAISSTTSNKDSAVFTYTNDKISKTIRHTWDGTGYIPGYEETFTYDGNGNMTSAKRYDIFSGTPVGEENRIYIYDAKTSPLKMGADAVLVGTATDGYIMESFSGNNNVNSYKSVDIPSGSTHFEGNVTYTYRSNGTPDKGNNNIIVAGIPVPSGTTTFFYQ